jgi:hypothetical protein
VLEVFTLIYFGVLTVKFPSRTALSMPHIVVVFSLPKQNYISELLGFWPLSIVRDSKKTREHNVSETSSPKT